MALDQLIHLIRVLSEGNLIAGFDLLRKALPSTPGFYAHGDYALSFGAPFAFAELTQGLDFQSAHTLDTSAFLSAGHDETGVAPEIARNIVTYLTAQGWRNSLPVRACRQSN